MIRANLTDEQLIERAESAGWEWRENSLEWPGSKAYPATGWMERAKASGARTFHSVKKLSSKAKILRCSGAPEHLGFDHHYDCRECGNPIWLQWLAPTDARLVERLECFNCHHWMSIIREGIEVVAERLERKTPDSNEFVLERHHYQVGPNKKAGPYNGFGGHKWLIEFLDGRKVETCDLWHQGTIPPLFYERMPVNAKLVG